MTRFDAKHMPSIPYQQAPAWMSDKDLRNYNNSLAGGPSPNSAYAIQKYGMLDRKVSGPYSPPPEGEQIELLNALSNEVLGQQPGLPQFSAERQPIPDNYENLLRLASAAMQQQDPTYPDYGVVDSSRFMNDDTKAGFDRQQAESQQRIDILRKWQDFDANARAAGDAQADEILRQSRPHAAPMDPMAGPVGPGAVSPSMLPDQSRGPSYQELSDFLAAREGNYRTPEQQAETAAAHDAAVQRIERGFGNSDTPVNIHEQKMANFKEFAENNPQVVSAQRERIAGNRANRDAMNAQKAQNSRNAMPLTQREVFSTATAGGMNPMAAALLGVDPRSIQAMNAPAQMNAEQQFRREMMDLEANLARERMAAEQLSGQADRESRQRIADMQFGQSDGEISDQEKMQFDALIAMATGDDPAMKRFAQQQLMQRVGGGQAGGAAAPTGLPQGPDQINQPYTNSSPATVKTMLGASGPGSVELGDNVYQKAAEAVAMGANPTDVYNVIMENISPDKVSAAAHDAVLQALQRGASAPEIKAAIAATQKEKQEAYNFQRERRMNNTQYSYGP